MTVESVTQAVSNLALEFGDDAAREGAMVRQLVDYSTLLYSVIVVWLFMTYSLTDTEKHSFSCHTSNNLYSS